MSTSVLSTEFTQFDPDNKSSPSGKKSEEQRLLAGPFSSSAPAENNPQLPPHHHKHMYRPTRLRWVALAEYSLLAFMNGFQWIIFSNIVDQTVGYFGISKFEVDWMSSIFYIMFLVTAIPAIAFFDKYGVRSSLLVASTCNLVSGLMKLVATLWVRQYWLLIVSQAIAGAAQSFFLPVPAALSCVWFGEDERTLATTVASVANPFGGAAGMIITTLFVNSEHSGMHAFASLFAFVSSLNLFDSLLLVFVVPERPKHSPSEAAHIRHELTLQHADVPIGARLVRIWQEARPYLSHGNTICILLGTGIAGGCFWTFTTLIAQIVQPFGVSQTTVGWMGFLNVLLGIPTGLAVGHWVDKVRVYKPTLLVTVASIVVLSGMFTLLLYTFPQVAVYTTVPLYIAMGGPQNVVLPIGFEAASETTFPLNENICSTLVLSGSEVMALVFMNVLPQVLAADGVSPQKAANGVCLLMTLVNAVAFCIILCGRVEMNRLKESENLETDSVTDAENDDDERERQSILASS